MIENMGDKGEEQTSFDTPGDVPGYISLAQARVIAMRAARGTPGDYGARFSGVNLTFEILDSAEAEEYYTVTLSFRPLSDFKGTPGQEQFFIEKTGGVRARQVLALPKRRGLPMLPVAIGLASVAVVGVAVVFLLIGEVVQTA